MLITVCICTHNRAALLAAALESACRQTPAPSDFEVIVVDNASTDQTRQVVENFSARFSNVRYFFEEKVGLSWARNRGWSEACGEYVGFLDDDAIAGNGWLEAAFQVIDAIQPDLFGGPYFAFYQSPKPAWFKDAYGSSNPHPQGKILTSPDEYLSGGNLFVRRSVLAQVGGFDPGLGMVGKRIAYGEETRFIRRVRQEIPGVTIYYEPALAIQHLVRPEKFSLRWQVRNRFNLGRYSYLAFSDGVHTLQPRHILAFLGLPFLMTGEATLGALLRSRRKYPYVQNYLYEVVLRHLATWGKLWERVGQVMRHES